LSDIFEMLELFYFFGEEEILELRSSKIHTNSWGQIT